MSEAKREIDPRHLEAATDALLGIEFRDEAHMNAAHILVANALADAESAQPAERAGEWVSVEERVPDGRNCIGYDCYYSRIGECEWNGYRLVFVDSQKDDCDITHWMPLPPPPQPKGKP